MKAWIMILGIGFLTFALRGSFVLLSEKRKIPDIFERALNLVPPAVLAALIMPALLCRSGGIDFGPGNDRLVAAGLAGLIAYKTRSVLFTLTGGMLALWALQTV